MPDLNAPTYGVVLFFSVSHAIRAEKLTVQAGLKVKLIPVTRQFSSNCGTALRFTWSEEDQVRQLLTEAGMEWDAIHPFR